MLSWIKDVPRRTLTAVLMVAAASAGLLGLLARRGSWFGDDLDYMVEGRWGLAPSVLLTPTNDHVVPGLRLVFGIFSTFGLSYDLTVVWRAVVHALAVVLFGTLVWRVTRARAVTAAVTVAYGLNPIGTPAWMQLSAAVNDLHAQLFALIFLHATLDWIRDGRRRSLGLSVAALALTLAFWLKAGLVVVTGLALWGVVSRSGTWPAWRPRFAAWACAALVPIVSFGVLVAVNRRSNVVHAPSADDLLGLLRETVTGTLTAPLTGGPWSWSDTPPYPFAAPPSWLGVLGPVLLGMALVAAVLWSRRALLLWGTAGVFVVATIGAVAPGRWEMLGGVIAANYHYWSDLIIPVLLAVAVTARDAAPHVARIFPRPAVLLALGAFGAFWAMGAVQSQKGFASQWVQNPSHAFFANLRAEVSGRVPGSVNVWDTLLPPTVAAPINTHRRVSEVAAVAGLNMSFQTQTSDPEVVRDDGRLVSGGLKEWASANVPPDCRLTVKGGSEAIVPLSTRLPLGHWFVTVAYVTGPRTDVDVYLVDRETGSSRPVTNAQGSWAPGLQIVRLVDRRSQNPVRADAVRFVNRTPGSELCLGTTRVGLVEAL